MCKGKRFDFDNVFVQLVKSGDSHPLASLSIAEAEEIHDRIRGMSLSIAKSSKVDVADLFDAAVFSIVSKISKWDVGKGSLVAWAIGTARIAMREHVGKEKHQLAVANELSKVCMIRNGLGMFCDDIEKLLSFANQRDAAIVREWLTGKSPDRIRMEVHADNAAKIRSVIERAVHDIAAAIGTRPCTVRLWNKRKKLTPVGVYAFRGRFQARIKRKGVDRFLGSFDTAEEAAEAVACFQKSLSN